MNSRRAPALRKTKAGRACWLRLSTTASRCDVVTACLADITEPDCDSSTTELHFSNTFLEKRIASEFLSCVPRFRQTLRVMFQYETTVRGPGTASSGGTLNG